MSVVAESAASGSTSIFTLLPTLTPHAVIAERWESRSVTMNVSGRCRWSSTSTEASSTSSGSGLPSMETRNETETCVPIGASPSVRDDQRLTAAQPERIVDAVRLGDRAPSGRRTQLLVGHRGERVAVAQDA